MRHPSRLTKYTILTVNDELGRIQADVVSQLERSHRVGGAQLHGSVDVTSRRVTWGSAETRGRGREC